MTERKWTQGNWVLDGGSVTSDALHEMDCIVDHVYGPEHNAHLITAAPELYEACEAVFDAADMTGKEQYAALKLVVAAMAKARGEK